MKPSLTALTHLAFHINATLPASTEIKGFQEFPKVSKSKTSVY
jgi:hypothetical protein